MSNEIEEEMEVDDLLDSLDEMARLDGAKSSIDAMQIIEDDFAEKTNEDDGIAEKTEIIENPAADTENIENTENSEDSENSEGEKTVTASFTDNENESSNHGSKKGGGSSSIVSMEQALPERLVLIPLQGRPIFPGIFTPLMISAPEDSKAVEQAYSSDGFIGLVMLKNDKEKPAAKDLYEIGTAARIIKKINLPDGGLNVFISTIKRFKIRKFLKSSGPIAAAVEYLNDEEDDTFEVKALTRALISEMKEVSENNPLFTEEMRLNMVNIDQPGKIADFITSILNIEKTDQQKVLELLNVRQRM